MVDEAIQHIDGSPAEGRYDQQREVADRLEGLGDDFDEVVERFYAYVCRDQSWRHHVPESEFFEAWSSIKIAAERAPVTRNRKGEARTRILLLWGEEATDLVHSIGSFNLLSSVRKCAKDLSYTEAMLRVNQSIVQRVGRPQRGVSNTISPVAGDFEKAHRRMVPAVPIEEECLQRLHMQVDERGFLKRGLCPIKSPGAEKPTDEVLGKEIPAFSMPGTVNPDAPSTEPRSPATAESPFPIFRPPSSTSVNDTSSAASTPLSSCPSSPTNPAESLDELSDSDTGYTEPPPKKRPEGPMEGCGCSRDVTSAWKVSVKSMTRHPLSKTLRLLREYHGFCSPCFYHSQRLASHLGLQTRQLTRVLLHSRLQTLYAHRDVLGKLKTAEDTYLWFRKTDRPPRCVDQLGPYRFTHAEPAPYQYDVNNLLPLLGVDVLETFNSVGSVVIPNLFSWWWEQDIPTADGNYTSVAAVLDVEFDMYRHHLRKIGGRENYGWLRNMVHSVGQQLMRQDPLYYSVYCHLRPDHHWRLVSYPYYAKYASKGDQTFFRHIDVNIPDLIATNRGASMIQGTVSLDDEDDSNCTEILPGMHRHLHTWWDRVVARGKDTNGFVHRISTDVYSNDDIDFFGIDWTKQPCPRGGIRVTLPHLPHGAQGPSSCTRRTMLPWFVAVQDDHEQLETVEAGTWSQLATAHRDLVAPHSSPSGLSNRYGAIPYRFPAAVELVGISALSDALVCRRRWDSPAVVADRNLLLGQDREGAARHVREWRRRAGRMVLSCFETMRRAEELAFGTRSFFYCQRHGIDGMGLPEDAEPSADVDGDSSDHDGFAER